MECGLFFLVGISEQPYRFTCVASVRLCICTCAYEDIYEFSCLHFNELKYKQTNKETLVG